MTVIDTLRLSAEDAIALLERREVSSGQLHEAYIEAIAARDGELHAYLRTVPARSAEGVGRSGEHGNAPNVAYSR